MHQGGFPIYRLEGLALLALMYQFEQIDTAASIWHLPRNVCPALRRRWIQFQKIGALATKPLIGETYGSSTAAR